MVAKTPRKYCLTLTISLLAAGHSVLALPALEVEFHFRDSRDETVFQEDKEALTATFVPHNFIKYVVKDEKTLAWARLVLAKKDPTLTELYRSAMAASMNGDRQLGLKLAILAVEKFGNRGPEDNPYFTFFYVWVIHSEANISLQMRAALDFAKFANRAPPDEVIPVMDEALRVAKDAHDTAAETIFARKKEAALNRLYSMAEDPGAADEAATVPWGVFRAEISNPASPLAQHAFQALAAGDAKEALRAFTVARKAWEAVEATAEKGGSYYGVSPLMVQIRRGLALAYGDLGDLPSAQEARMSLAAYMRTEALPRLINQLNIDSQHGYSVSQIVSSDIFAMQSLLLPANHPEDGTLAEALLGWKGVTAVYRRALNQRRGELPPTDLRQLKQMEAYELVVAARTGAEFSFDRIMKDMNQRPYADLSDKGRKILDQTVRDVSNPKINTDALRGVLSVHGVFVDYLRFPYYEGHGVWQLRYGALIVTKGRSPEWVNLGPATLLDDLIVRHNAQLLDDSGDEADEHYVNTLRELSAAVWRPLAMRIPKDATDIWICPDAGVGSVSFAALLDSQDHFVGESVNIGYCVNGRDLIESRARSQTRTITLLGFPEYDREKKSKHPSLFSKVPVSTSRSAFAENGAFRELRGTRVECERIAARARDAGYQANLRLGPAASEAELNKVASPRVLHLSTHGFYYSFASEDTPSPRMSDNPHNASGIALAGANTTIRAWSAGKVPAASDDGIVTALEASRLDLRNTELTVLSSCKSGNGHQVSGIGVIGLRGALYQAGTRNLLVTLWPVDDEQSVTFMVEFYDRLFRGNDIQTALSSTQRQFLSAFRNEEQGTPAQNIRRAVRCFGPFLLNSTGSLVGEALHREP